MTIVHLGTVIQSTFGTLDEDGNVIQGEPIAVNVPVFSDEKFLDARQMIAGERDDRAAKAAEADAALGHKER